MAERARMVTVLVQGGFVLPATLGGVDEMKAAVW